MTTIDLVELLAGALEARLTLLDERHETALRLFNGFVEGEPALTVELYARTLLIKWYGDDPITATAMVDRALEFYRAQLPWLRAGVLKLRHGAWASERSGKLLFGERPDRRIREQEVTYAIDLLFGRDTSFYLDTRLLRAWLRERMAGLCVLNAFAYTGSLGVAARAGNAARVVQLDLNRSFLNLAKESFTLNGFPIVRGDFQVGDFFPLVGRLRRAGTLFDCVLLDPPFFSLTPHGRVDMVASSARLLNKVRPLIADEGYLVAVNNALFVAGADYMAALNELCADGYLTLEELIAVPPDCAGYPQTVRRDLPSDPSPFNHSTKIVVLRARRKDGRRVASGASSS